VYSRQIDGRTLTLSPSGWTYRNTFVLYDRESGTLWYPVKQELNGIQGKYFGRILAQMESEDTRWHDWHAKHADSQVLK